MEFLTLRFHLLNPTTAAFDHRGDLARFSLWRFCSRRQAAMKPTTRPARNSPPLTARIARKVALRNLLAITLIVRPAAMQLPNFQYIVASTNALGVSFGCALLILISPAPRLLKRRAN